MNNAYLPWNQSLLLTLEGGRGRVGGFSDSIHCRRFMLSPRIPYNFLVWVYNYTILLSYFKRLINKDFPPS